MSPNMSTDSIKMLMLHYLKLQNDAKCVLAILNKRSIFYRRKRRQYLINILIAMRKRALILKQIQSKPRDIWAKNRPSVFWEKDVAESDDNFFKENFRMSRQSFEILCNKLKGLEKQNTNYRKSIPLRKRIAIALYTIGSLTEYQKIACLFGVGKCTVGNIFKTFYEEVLTIMAPMYLTARRLPESIIDEIVNVFKDRGLPLYFGVIGDSRIAIQPAIAHLEARFRRISKPDNYVDKVPLITKACCALHNFLNDQNDDINYQWLCTDLLNNSPTKEVNRAVKTKEHITMFLALNEGDDGDGDRLGSTYSKTLIGGDVVGGDGVVSLGDGDGIGESERLNYIMD